MPHTTTSAHAARLLAAMTLAAATASAQTVWDGNGDANASGNWNVQDNWSTNLVPSAVAVELNDVTTGMRTVTYNSAEAAINGLSITQSTAGATNRLVIDTQTLSNTGSTFITQTAGSIIWDILNGGTYRLSTANARSISSAATLTLGSSLNATSGNMTAGPASGTGGNLFTFNNTGTVTLNNASEFGYRSNISASTTAGHNFNNNAGGELNLAGATTGTGIRMGVLDNNSNPATPVLTNAAGATVNVTRVASESSGTGLAGWGMYDGGNQRAGSTVTNNGEFNIAGNAQFTLQGRRNNTDSTTATFNNNADAVLNIGNSGSTTEAGTLAFQISSASATDNNNVGMRFLNTGTVNAYGTSVIRIGAGSVAAADGDNLTVTNNTGGVINLHDTSSIGTTGRGTLFSNAGTLVKHAAGTASILSNGSGSVTNTGLIHVKDGALSFSSGIDSTGGDLRFDLGNADISSARLLAPSITLSGSALELVFTAALTDDRSYNLWDSSVSGTFDSITLSGFGFSGTYTSTSFTSNGYDFSLDIANGLLTATQVIPEPSAFAALAGLGALGFATSRRRRR
jgi:hypothetical protein